MTIYKLPDTKAFESCLNNKNTHLLTLANRTGMQIALSDYGARLVSVLVPDKHGTLVDVVLGFNNIDGYIHAKEQYHGATIGRYANRIAGGHFQIGNTSCSLAQNNGENSLHGGPEGFHRKVWDRQVSLKKQVDFYYVSPDGEEGFPGTLNTCVSYELTNENEIKIYFRATTDKTTVINLTNHAYFNLNGEGNGDILNHYIQIPSSNFIPINSKQIPTGQISPVEDTSFDFRVAKKIAQEINSSADQIQYAMGYDHGFVNESPISTPAATAYSEGSGILLEVFTDQPSVHLYTGNFLANDQGKSGHRYLKHGGFCFEAQHYPDSPNQGHFPAVILSPGEEFQHTIIYKFSVKK
ncbi:aldose epimerase family protein [Sphingobacterium faecale]|uniref:Aldose 1-epimerase n=1 Tax=Sphingobacterium faecale TaxID=2803775 RepID=A0ABS1R290_9SPHI|nr:aldose epimerase family protein [Sphingobacterium faecale]MBL1408157.1 galactose mutarotase [Sphingobacterium faecale]